MAIKTKYISDKPKQYLVVTAKNAKGGDTRNGNPWRSFGLKIESGPRVTESGFVNYFRVITDKTTPYYKKDCKLMGITNDTPDNFQCDGRKFTVIWAEEEYEGKREFKVVAVIPYDASKFPKEVTEAPNDDELPF